ncbi:ATP-binding cassette domain-containing protein [bacterium]|nr:ATP-binding cassette domain-containing protein [bacterium]
MDAQSGERAVELAVDIGHLSHRFGEGETQVRALSNIDLQIRRGEVIILMGPSGSGKTTLLTLIGCLRSVQTGSVKLLGQELNGASELTLMAMRRRLGFIFQAHNLHKSLTALQNVRMGLEVHGESGLRDWRDACEQALRLVNLGNRLEFLPEKLSGGQKQRVAVARALVGNPDVVFADEPTAALDRENGRLVVDLFRNLADQRQTTVLIVTHDHRIMDVADRILKMEEGRIVEDLAVDAAVLAAEGGAMPST